MRDPDDRTRIDEDRADGAPEWEVFLRESECEPLRHAGSVSAPTPTVAHEQATRLFPEAGTLWLCRADRVERFADRDLGAAHRTDGDAADPDATAPADDEPTATDGGDTR